MNKVVTYILLIVLAIIGSVLAGCFLATILENVEYEGVIGFVELIFTNSTAQSMAALIFLCITLAVLFKFMNKSPSSSGKIGAKTKDGKSMEQYYSSRFISEKELRTQKKFMYSLYSDLKMNKRDGIPLRAELKHGKLHINMYKPIHTIVIGTTGSGKTTMLVSPTIQILSETASKPSMVISDPKGELFLLHSEKLVKSGYDVQVIDLREPDKSSRWNPLQIPYENYQYAHSLKSRVKTHIDENPEDFKHLKKIKGSTYVSQWYEFNGVAYPNKQTLESDLTAIKDIFINKATEEISVISSTLCPIQGQDPSWSRGAQGFIKAILIAMLEDSLIPELNLTKDKFNFFNLTQIATRRDEDQNDSTKTLRNYFAGRDILSEAVNLANTVIANAAVTTKGYLGNVTGALSMFSDSGICYLTSGTDIDLNNFADKPSALFIKIPDEKDTRHALANMYISQLYGILIDRANKRGKEKGEIELPRNVYFILDEFGNLPKLEKLKSFITAGRSRRIFLMLVIQDYTQLNSIYGEQDAATIRNNCNIHIFIGTKDAKTREEFAKNCGNLGLEVTTTGETVGSKSESASKSKNVSMVQRPLIYPDELDHLEQDQVVINCFKEFSMKTKFTPTYKNSFYYLKAPAPEYTPSKALDKRAVFYDIAIRNDIVLKTDDEEDDDDFDFLSPFGKRKK